MPRTMGGAAGRVARGASIRASPSSAPAPKTSCAIAWIASCPRVSETPRRVGIDAPTVARLVARGLTHTPSVAQTPVPRWYPPLQQSIASAVRSLRRALDRADALGPNEVHALREELLNLQGQVQRLLARVDQGQKNEMSSDERGS